MVNMVVKTKSEKKTFVRTFSAFGIKVKWRKLLKNQLNYMLTILVSVLILFVLLKISFL